MKWFKNKNKIEPFEKFVLKKVVECENSTGKITTNDVRFWILEYTKLKNKG